MVAVLLIEDDQNNREAKAGLLKRLAGGGPVVAVESSDAAIRALRTLPGFELIVSDISLPVSKETMPEANRDGIAFARWVADVGYPAAVAGYSAVFSEREISDSDKSLFFDFLGKTEPAEEIVKRVGNWIAHAEGFRDRSRFGVKDSADERRGSINSRPSFSDGIQSLEVVDLTKQRIIKELMDDGYSVKLAFSDKIADGIRPFFVWTRDTVDDGCFVEVFGCPRLYAAGADIDDAEARLIELMRGYYSDLKDQPEERLSSDIRNMMKFLEEIFHAQ